MLFTDALFPFLTQWDQATRPQRAVIPAPGLSILGVPPGIPPKAVKLLKAALINFSLLILHSPLRICGLGIDFLVLYFVTIQISLMHDRNLISTWPRGSSQTLGRNQIPSQFEKKKKERKEILHRIYFQHLWDWKGRERSSASLLDEGMWACSQGYWMYFLHFNQILAKCKVFIDWLHGGREYHKVTT